MKQNVTELMLNDLIYLNQTVLYIQRNCIDY